MVTGISQQSFHALFYRLTMALDRQAVLKRIDNDHELYDEICEIFQDDAPEIVRRLKDAIGSGEILVATRHAHSLKSVSANIGATAMSELAHHAEIAGRDSNLQAMRNQIPLIEKELAELLKELRQ